MNDDSDAAVPAARRNRDAEVRTLPSDQERAELLGVREVEPGFAEVTDEKPVRPPGDTHRRGTTDGKRGIFMPATTLLTGGRSSRPAENLHHVQPGPVDYDQAVCPRPAGDARGTAGPVNMLVAEDVEHNIQHHAPGMPSSVAAEKVVE